jgi:DNA-binding NarL/FixJ family response regulator
VSIIEDDKPTREILGGWLSRAEGLKFVSQFESAEDCLARLPQQKPDVVLMDIKLPGMNGVECVRQLKPQLPLTQFVMLTACEDISHVFAALAAGANGYLLKPIHRQRLLAALKDVHAGGSPLSSYVARKVVESFHSAVPIPSPTRELCNLPRRQRQVLEFLALGSRCGEIAETLGISVNTVNTHIQRIFKKLHVHSARQAVSLYRTFS